MIIYGNLTIEEYENLLDELIQSNGSLWLEFHVQPHFEKNKKYGNVHFVEKYFHTEYNIYLFL